MIVKDLSKILAWSVIMVSLVIIWLPAEIVLRKEVEQFEYFEVLQHEGFELSGEELPSLSMRSSAQFVLKRPDGNLVPVEKIESSEGNYVLEDYRITLEGWYEVVLVSERHAPVEVLLRGDNFTLTRDLSPPHVTQGRIWLTVGLFMIALAVLFY